MFRFSDANRGLFWTLLVVDLLAVLVALYHQSNAGHSAVWGWVFVAGMATLTVLFVVVAREKPEEDEILQGLPPRGGASDEIDEDGSLDDEAKG